MIKINSTTIKTPQSFSVGISDLDGESTRVASGDLVRDRLAVKRKLEVGYGALTPTEISAILTAIQDEFFTVEYPDPMTGSLQTKTFYVGDRTTPMYSNINGEPLWENLSFNLIEK